MRIFCIVIVLTFNAGLSSASTNRSDNLVGQCQIDLGTREGSKSILADFNDYPASPEKTAAEKYMKKLDVYRTPENAKNIRREIEYSLYTMDRNTYWARVWTHETKLPYDDLLWIYQALVNGRHRGFLTDETEASAEAHREIIKLLSSTLKYVPYALGDKLPSGAIAGADGRAYVLDPGYKQPLIERAFWASISMGVSLIQNTKIPPHMREIKKLVLDETELKKKLDDQTFRSRIALMVFSKRMPFLQH